MGHLQELEAALAPYFKARSSDDLLGRFEDLGVPAGPVYDINQMHEDPQVLARKMVVEVEHSALGPVRTIGLPVKFSDTPGEVAHGAPTFGQHTVEILREHGFADHEIESLLADGAVAER